LILWSVNTNIWIFAPPPPIIALAAPLCFARRTICRRRRRSEPSRKRHNVVLREILTADKLRSEINKLVAATKRTTSYQLACKGKAIYSIKGNNTRWSNPGK
jgi:hypothetical protein